MCSLGSVLITLARVTTALRFPARPLGLMGFVIPVLLSSLEAARPMMVDVLPAVHLAIALLGALNVLLVVGSTPPPQALGNVVVIVGVLPLHVLTLMMRTLPVIPSVVTVSACFRAAVV